MTDNPIEVDGDKLLEIIDQMTVMGEQMKQQRASHIRITMMLFDLLGMEVPPHLTEAAGEPEVSREA